MSNEWPRYYILLDRLPVAVDLMTWARTFENSNRQIGDDQIGNVRVSTVFLGLDHNWRETGDPILFETLIFGGPLDGHGSRYATYADAERGHAEFVTQAKIAAARIKAIAETAGATS